MTLLQIFYNICLPRVQDKVSDSHKTMRKKNRISDCQTKTRIMFNRRQIYYINNHNNPVRLQRNSRQMRKAQAHSHIPYSRMHKFQPMLLLLHLIRMNVSKMHERILNIEIVQNIHLKIFPWLNFLPEKSPSHDKYSSTSFFVSSELASSFVHV